MMHEHPRQVSVFAIVESLSSSPFRFHGTCVKTERGARSTVTREHTSRIEDYNLYVERLFFFQFQKKIV